MADNAAVERLCERAETDPEDVVADLDECIQLANLSQSAADREAVNEALRKALFDTSPPDVSAVEFRDYIAAIRILVREIEQHDTWESPNPQIISTFLQTIVRLGRDNVTAIRSHSTALTHLLGECIHLLKPNYPEAVRKRLMRLFGTIRYPGESPSILDTDTFCEYTSTARSVLRDICEQRASDGSYGNYQLDLGDDEGLVSEFLCLLGVVATDYPDVLLPVAKEFRWLIGGTGETDVQLRLGFFEPIIEQHPEAFLSSLETLIEYASIRDGCSYDAARTAVHIAYAAPEHFVQIAADNRSFLQAYPHIREYSSDPRPLAELEQIFDQHTFQKVGQRSYHRRRYADDKTAVSDTDVLTMIRQFEAPFVTVTDVTEILDCSWEAAREHLLDLHDQGAINRRQVSPRTVICPTVGGHAFVWWPASDRSN